MTRGGRPAYGVAVPAPRDPDEILGRDHFDRLVRGDAMIGLIADVPAFEAAMVEALWAAAQRGSGSAFMTLGECHAAAVGFGPIGAFDGIAAEGAADREWSPAARAITDEGDEGVEAALRCFAEAARLGVREAAMRFAKVARLSSRETQVEALRLLQALRDPSAAELYQRGLVQHWLGDLGASCASHTAAAAAGDADAMFELYLYYGQGLGVAPDAAASRRWLERAAEAGQARALYNLGAAWASGREGRVDMARAADYYQRAADRGNGRAAATLAVMMLTEELDRDDAQAGRWLDRAEELGFPAWEMLASLELSDPRAR